MKYFSKLEIKNSKAKYIKSLYIGENLNTLITDPNEILEAQKTFYADLYKEPSNIIHNPQIFDNIEIPQLNETNKNLCEKLITLEELSKSLKLLPNNKTPGSDGLTTEFYKFFWLKIKHLVYESIMFAYDCNTLSIEQKRGILSIIPKKDKDLRFLKNWRPLTLLNTDYKILTKLLALRLQKVLPSIISNCQTGYLKGRYIGDNICTIFDVIEYTRIHQLQGMMVLIDFEKAFDSISWHFLFKTLKIFNFGDSFRKWIEIIYNNPECCVTNNGFSSQFFKVSRGIRQGCPISALLFLLVVEVMSLHIKQNQKIEGIPIGNFDIKISQLADDTTLFLRDIDSLREALSFLDIFKCCTGLKLNRSKTEIIWLGSQCNSTVKPLGLRVTNSSVRCLGVLCNTNVTDAVNENFVSKIKKLKKLLAMWSQRNLSLKGKITFLRTMAIPQILYIASVLPVPKWVIKEADQLFFSFLWNNKKHFVSRKVITSSIEQGGLRMPDIKSIIRGIKCTWVTRLIKADPCKQELLKSFILYKGKSIVELLKCKLSAEYITFRNDFYKEIFNDWYEVYSKTSKKISLNECLWNNKFLVIDNKPVHFPDWERHNIKIVRDIYDDNCNILSKPVLENKFGFNIKQMSYNSLIHALPNCWKNIGEKNNEKNVINVDAIFIYNAEGKYVKLEEMFCKQFTNIFLSYNYVRPAAEIKWQKYLSVEGLAWQECYKQPYLITQSTEMQSLQYRILHRFYPCNYLVAKWSKEVEATCNNCNALDLLEHYFFECKELTIFWNGLRKWWLNNLGCSFTLTAENVIFGLNNEYKDKMIDIIKYCILIAKFFIVKCKQNNYETSLYDYLRLLKNKLEIELLYCKLYNKESSYNKLQMLYEII